MVFHYLYLIFCNGNVCVDSSGSLKSNIYLILEFSLGCVTQVYDYPIFFCAKKLCQKATTKLMKINLYQLLSLHFSNTDPTPRIL